MQQVLPLSDRVRAALNEPITSADLDALIAETCRDIEAIGLRLRDARDRAVDPLSSDTEAAEARREHHDLGFEEERATASVARLRHRREAVWRDEVQAERRANYDAAVKARDAMAARLCDEYPKHAAAIIALLRDLASVEHQVRTCQSHDGAPHMHGVESTILGGHPLNGNDGIWPIAGTIRLPARYGLEQAWPEGLR